MDDRIRRAGDVLTLGATWAVLWPVTGLAIVGVLAIVLGPDGDVGAVEIIWILAPLGLIAGLVFGVVAVAFEGYPRIGGSSIVAVVVGVAAAIVAGLIAGIQPTAILNAMVLGAIAGPLSLAVADRTTKRRVAAA